MKYYDSQRNEILDNVRPEELKNEARSNKYGQEGELLIYYSLKYAMHQQSRQLSRTSWDG